MDSGNLQAVKFSSTRKGSFTKSDNDCVKTASRVNNLINIYRTHSEMKSLCP